MKRFIILLLPLVFATLAFTSCASPAGISATETSAPSETNTSTPLPTSTATLTPSPTPVPSFHLGMDGITSMTDCNQLSLGALNTQMPKLVEQELAAYAAGTTIKPFGFDSGSGIIGGPNEPWDTALISQRIQASDITCGQLEVNGHTMFTITLPMISPDGSERTVVTYSTDETALRQRFANNPTILEGVLPQTLFDAIVAARNGGKMISLNMATFFTSSDSRHPDLQSGIWADSKTIMDMFNTQPFPSITRLPTLAEIPDLQTSYVLRLMVSDRQGVTLTDEIRHALYQEFTNRAAVIPVELIDSKELP